MSDFERVDAVDDEHVQVDVEVQRRAESLDEGDGSGAGAGAHAQSGATGEEGGDCPVDDGKDLGEDRGARREQEPQRVGERHHPLADRLLGQDVVDEMRGGLGHAACAAARAEAAAFATERHELLMPAGLALDAQESVFETPTLEVRLELFHDEVGQ
jgi:hypothetical protein